MARARWRTGGSMSYVHTHAIQPPIIQLSPGHTGEHGGQGQQQNQRGLQATQGGMEDRGNNRTRGAYRTRRGAWRTGATTEPEGTTGHTGACRTGATT